MGVALLDSSALVAYLDADDDLHGDAVEAIEATMRAGNSLAISVVTWSELLHGTVLGHHDEAVLREFVGDFGIDVIEADLDTAEHAAALQRAYHRAGKSGEERKLRTPDALILGTYKQHDDIEQLICGDNKWLRIPGLDPRQVTMLRPR